MCTSKSVKSHFASLHLLISYLYDIKWESSTWNSWLVGYNFNLQINTWEREREKNWKSCERRQALIDYRKQRKKSPNYKEFKQMSMEEEGGGQVVWEEEKILSGGLNRTVDSEYWFELEHALKYYYYYNYHVDASVEFMRMWKTKDYLLRQPHNIHLIGCAVWVDTFQMISINFPIGARQIVVS